MIDIDISNVASLRTRSGWKVLQAINGGKMIAYEDANCNWWVVHLDGRLARTYESPGDLIYCLPDPWAGVVLPEWIEVRLYDTGNVMCSPVLVHRSEGVGSMVSTRRFRLVPMEGEE